MQTLNKIRIWSHDFSLNKRENVLDGDAIGAINCTRQEILLRNNLKPAQEVETLIHELLHAVTYYTNIISEREVEEKIVDTYAAGLTLILKDNPKLVNYIGEILHGKSKK